MKIVLIGAGSCSFGRGQIVDVLKAEEFRGRDVTLSLVDVSPASLDLMTRVAERAKSHFGSDVRIESATDRRQVLPDADYVVVAVSVRRHDLWEQDFRIPLSFGFNHVLGENGGPGALFHALRSFELMIPICRDIEELCPKTLLLNFTNPEARVLHAICHLTHVRAAGICHGVFDGLRSASHYLDKPVEELDIVSAGMNHFYVLLQVLDRATGEDLLPTLLRRVCDDSSGYAKPLFQRFARVFDVVTFNSDDHIGEYVAFGSEFHGTQWDYGMEKRTLSAASPPKENVLLEYAEGKRPVDDPQVVGGSSELTVPIICDMELNRNRRRPAVNVLNTEGYIENLPRDIVVEVPARVDGEGIHPVAVGTVPEPMAAFMRPHYTIHGLLTEAYRTRSKKLLLQALLLDPNVNSVLRAEAMLEEMLAKQAAFLPSFTREAS